jgi:hypothetical protein
VTFHLGEIAQDDRWEKQRSGRMMELHRRSRAGPVPASGQASAADPQCPIGVNHVNQRIEPDEPSKSRPTSSPSDVGQDPAASSILRAAGTFSGFGIPKPTVRGFCVSGSSIFVAIGNWQRASFGKGTNPKTYRITVGSFADPDFRPRVVHHSFMETSTWPGVNDRRLGSFR